MTNLLEYGEIAIFWAIMGGSLAGHIWLISIGLSAAGF